MVPWGVNWEKLAGVAARYRGHIRPHARNELAAIGTHAISCGYAEASRRAGPAALVVQDRDRLKLLEREVKELRRANEILRKASAYFAQAELDRQGKW